MKFARFISIGSISNANACIVGVHTARCLYQGGFLFANNFIDRVGKLWKKL